MRAALLETTGLTLDLGGRRLLEDIGLAIAAGEVHALVGANGSGKTTLARTLLGAEGYVAAKGTVRFAGADLLALPMRKRARLGLAIAWQEPVALEGFRVADYLRYGPVKRTPPHAEIGGVDRRQLENLMARGLSPEAAVDRIVLGMLR